MKKILILMALAAQLLAQRSEIVRVQQEPIRIMGLLKPMIPEGTKVAFDDRLKIITLSGTPEVVEMLISNIRRLDLSPTVKSIELTVHLILGSETDAKMPGEFRGVLEQLHAIFPFKGYQLLDTTVHRSLEGKGGELNGVIPGPPEMPSATYRMKFDTANVNGDGNNRQVSIVGLDFNSRYPYTVGQPAVPGTSTFPQYQFAAAEMHTDVVLREGQKVVIGKSSLGRGKESLFVALSAKVVD
jgi:hypothetical protein